jgi:hypothetical protein
VSHAVDVHRTHVVNKRYSFNGIRRNTSGQATKHLAGPDVDSTEAFKVSHDRFHSGRDPISSRLQQLLTRPVPIPVAPDPALGDSPIQLSLQAGFTNLNIHRDIDQNLSLTSSYELGSPSA